VECYGADDELVAVAVTEKQRLKTTWRIHRAIVFQEIEMLEFI
jgi:hypothetical protein